MSLYMLEYLLGMYCSSQDESAIEQGSKTLRIFSKELCKARRGPKIISKLRELGSYTVIDKVSVRLNYKTDTYEAEFSNLGLRGVPIPRFTLQIMNAYWPEGYGVSSRWNISTMKVIETEILYHK